MKIDTGLKVRVWHKELKKFLPKEEWCLDFDGGLIFVDSASIGEDGVQLVAVPQNLYVISHYTGLLDKNDKEIYEGDILKIQTNDDPEDLQWELYRVFYDEGSFWCGDTTKWYQLYEYNIDAEIIVNIYEHPELLIK